MTEKSNSSAAPAAVIKVIGVGGGGGNAINSMIASGITGVEFIAANTDVQALKSNAAPIKIQLGRELTKGLGAGANPDVGRDAALEDKAILQEVLAGADMVFVTAGMGGGTGTGAAPIIAHVAREMGALTLAVVTKPFSFEGKKRKNQCEHGIASLKEAVDTLITIPNQRLLSIAPPHMTMLDSFKLADEVLVNAVRGISDIINISGHINVDFADVRRIMSSMGMALMGIGTATGPNRAAEAARLAISSPLLEDVDIEGATGLLINITSSKDITLQEVHEACTLIQESAHEDADVIFGHAFDESLQDTLRITVIATGFDQGNTLGVGQNQFLNPFAKEQSPTPNHHHQTQNTYSNRPTMNQGHNSQSHAMPPQGTRNQAHNSQTYSSNAGNQAYNGNVSRGTAQQTPTAPNFPRFPTNSEKHTENQPIGTPSQAPQRNTNTLSSLSNQTIRSQLANESFPTQELHPGTIRSEAEHLTHWTLRQTQQQPAQTPQAEHNTDMSLSPQESVRENNGVENALNLAEELSQVEIDETDYETPAFLRR
jgi:cell division protein FtsZ